MGTGANTPLRMKKLTLIIALMALAVVCTVTASAKDFVVVIDPGHGGKDSGSTGTNASEKDINLAVAKQLASRINAELPGVKAVLTRSDDSFVTLKQRADIANRSGGDLFVSLHVNSLPKGTPGWNTTHGSQVFTLGPDRSQSNLNVAKRENSVMELEADFSKNYRGFDPTSTESYIIFELTQSKHMRQSADFATLAQKHLTGTAGRKNLGIMQSGFWVLWATSMPSVLVELDFICHPEAEAFLNSDDGRRRCAGALFNAVAEYVRKNRK